jgi:flagellar motor switch protein FliN/FliY
MSENKPAQSKEKSVNTNSLEFIHDVTLGVSVELGRTDLPIERLMQLKKGSVIEMEKLSEEPLDIRVNGKLVARGEAVIVNEMFGIRVTQVIAPEGEEVI